MFVVLAAGWAATNVAAAGPSSTSDPQSVAFLGVRFINDNEGLEPTTDAERARLKKIEQIFTMQLEDSGRYRLVAVSSTIEARIAAGQPIGECGGCEIKLGKELGAALIAWINIQKVSNLILNMNVYMADVASEKMTFVRSVDIRGNTDESWSRSLNYLLKNYLLAP
ncbi:MAG: DUF3280 domain-containing protein [Hyphomicrobium sp.]|nr:MAG: DUF3280 domain-containing protein [Hyphomicrobium sp.]MBZ0210066.1 DUF3280 domain-containing protein [Hyphomicrobium sp.]